MNFDDYCKETGHYAENGDRALWEAATKEEREACAKVCDRHANTTWNDDRKMQARVDAADIRMRSNG